MLPFQDHKKAKIIKRDSLFQALQNNSAETLELTWDLIRSVLFHQSRCTKT